MNRTDFENAVVNDAFSWYATTDEFKLNFENIESARDDIESNRDTFKNFIERYWNNYFGYSS